MMSNKSDFNGGRFSLPEPQRKENGPSSFDIRKQKEAFQPANIATAPEAAPNVVVILLDDLGFGTSSAFGGPCKMPAAERLAGGGLRYNRFHVTALCSPTRQSLLTGRNHHSVGMGAITDWATSAPGYNAVRPRSAGTIAQILSANGYSTGAFGKWHQTPVEEVSVSGPFDRWPTGEGFDKFYGFMGAEMNHWHPLLYEGTTPFEPERTPEEGYHLSEDLVDQAINWVDQQQALTPDRPFFTYLAFGASHAPLHVSEEWRKKYRGAFDHGWDRQREMTLERQKEKGIVPPSTQLSDWPETVPKWDDLSEDERSVSARYMETFAAFTEHADTQVDRFLDYLDDNEMLDNTIIVYILGDNGASGEGGLTGSLMEIRLTEDILDDPEEVKAMKDRIGEADTYPIAPAGWALALNTPHPWTKQIASHLGGVRDGMIVHWPREITEPGGIRSQYHHVIDIMPTIFDCIGIPAPLELSGVTQQPIEGISLRYSFNDSGAEDRRKTQYYEMLGNRGIYHEGWLACARHGVPWEMVSHGDRSFENDVWELYDLDADWSQSVDLAAQHPDRLRELQDLFLIEAAKHQVFPLDDRAAERANPSLAGRREVTGSRPHVTYPGTVRRVSEHVAPNVKNRSHTLEADVTLEVSARTGVIVAQGGRFGGWSLYIKEGVIHYAYNLFGSQMTYVIARSKLDVGRHRLEMRFTYAGGGVGQSADVELFTNGVSVGRGIIDRTAAFSFSYDETLDVGVDLGTPVTDDYPIRGNGFPGDVHSVTFHREEGWTGTPEDELRASLTVQ